MQSELFPISILDPTLPTTLSLPKLVKSCFPLLLRDFHERTNLSRQRTSLCIAPVEHPLHSLIYIQPAAASKVLDSNFQSPSVYTSVFPGRPHPSLLSLNSTRISHNIHTLPENLTLSPSYFVTNASSLDQKNSPSSTLSSIYISTLTSYSFIGQGFSSSTTADQPLPTPVEPLLYLQNHERRQWFRAAAAHMVGLC